MNFRLERLQRHYSGPLYGRRWPGAKLVCDRVQDFDYRMLYVDRKQSGERRASRSNDLPASTQLSDLFGIGASLRPGKSYLREFIANSSAQTIRRSNVPIRPSTLMVVSPPQVNSWAYW